jgi:H+/Cl- antiporter ClcA
VVAAAGTFAAVSMIFSSPLIAAIILIEATGLGGPTLRLVLLPGLTAAAIGSLVSIGMGAWTGLSTSDYALGPLSLPAFPRPGIADFAWTIPLAAAVAAGSVLITLFARQVLRLVRRRPFVLLPASGLVIGGLAIAFSKAADKGVDQVLFSGQDQLGQDVVGVGTWSLGALALLILFKGLAWGISLAGFRGGPTFPALFLGSAAGMMAAHLPGFSETPGVAVGMSAAVVAVLKLPLSAVVIGILLTSKAGLGASPLVIIGVVVAYVTTVALEGVRIPEKTPAHVIARAAGG